MPINIDVVAAAIRKAIAGGVVAAPADHHLSDDQNFVRSQTDVGVPNDDLLTTFIGELRADPEMAKFDIRYANTSIGGGVSQSLISIGRTLLAQAVVSGDVQDTVARFSARLERNSTDAIAVMAIAGLETDRELQLGPNVRIVPIGSVPPSGPRSAALGQGFSLTGNDRINATHAVVTSFEFKPVFYIPKKPQPPEEISAWEKAQAAFNLLEEAYTVLALFGVGLRSRMMWVQPADWLLPGAMLSSWRYSSELWHGRLVKLNSEAVEQLSRDYFALPADVRHKYLRIPLDRLRRSLTEADWADKAIDLGIALEALLLNEVGNETERGELRFRLSLRGAWLIGRGDGQRQEIQSVLKGIYDLRSQAVHAGAIEISEKVRILLDRATSVCESLIRKMIEHEGKVNWNRLVLGGDF